MTKADQQVRAAIYLRQSFDRSGEGAAVERQREDCIALCNLKRWEIAQFYEDNDVSAYTGRRRPQFEAMKADAAAGRFDAVVVFHLDRLLRRVVELEPLIDLELPISSVTGDLDLSTPTGRMVARLIVTVAQHEVEHKSFRQKRANLTKAAEGRPAGGHVPFGFKDDFVTHNRSEANAIKRAYKLVIATQGAASLRGIAREWNAAGFRTARGNEWQPRSVRDCLLGARNAGLRTHGKDRQIVGQAVWKQIVDYQVWEDARVLLTNPERRTSPGNARKYMMSGLARCGICAATMTTGWTQHGKRTYICSQTKHLSIGAEPIDEFIREIVVTRLRRPDAQKLLVESPSAKTDRQQRQLARMREKRDQLPLLFVKSEVSPAEITAAIDQLTDDIHALERKIKRSGRADILREIVDGPDPALAWDAFDVARRRSVVDCLMTVTFTSPGQGKRTFQPSSVTVGWK